VVDDGAAGAGAEIVALVGALGGGEVVFCVEGVVAQKFVSGTVKLIGSGFDGHADHPRRGAAEFGGVAVGYNLELLDGVDGRFDDFFLIAVGGKNGLTVVIDAVEQERSGGTDLAADAHSDGGSGDAVGHTGDGGNCAGRECGELQIVAAVEGQVLNLLVVDNGAYGGVRGLQQGCGGFDAD